MNVILLANTPDPESLVAMAAKLCYSKLTLEELIEKVQAVDNTEFINKLLSMGHESPFEHISFTFGITGVSRAFLAQITRHRIASFSVKSQRYCGNNHEYVVPPSIEALGDEAVCEFVDDMEVAHAAYDKWMQVLPVENANEDSRFVLPEATATQMIVTMNARELMRFFSLRSCKRAQWEIRAVSDKMLGMCQTIAPALFRQAGAPCSHGKCTQGDMGCRRSD